jgi:hypothetical protein
MTVAGLVVLCLAGLGIGGFQALPAHEPNSPIAATPTVRMIAKGVLVLERDKAATSPPTKELKSPKVGQNVPPGTFFAVLRVTHFNAQSAAPTQTLTDGKDEALPGWVHRTTYGLPPVPNQFLEGKKRIDVEIRLAGEGGESTLLLSERNIQLPWSGSVPLGSRGDGVGFRVEQDGEQLRVWSQWLLR